MLYNKDHRLLQEAYQQVHKESPDEIYVNHERLSWGASARLVVPYMNIAGQWYFGNAADRTETHIELFKNVVAQMVLQNKDDWDVPNNPLQKLIAANYDGLNEDFVIYVIDIISRHPSTKGLFDVKRAISGLWSDENVDDYRLSTTAGRAWLDAKLPSMAIPGLLISNWNSSLNPTQKKEIETVLSNYIETKYKFPISRIVWDGDPNIDPSAQHTQAARKPMKNIDWDQLKYQ